MAVVWEDGSVDFEGPLNKFSFPISVRKYIEEWGDCDYMIYHVDMDKGQRDIYYSRIWIYDNEKEDLVPYITTTHPYKKFDNKSAALRYAKGTGAKVSERFVVERSKEFCKWTYDNVQEEYPEALETDLLFRSFYEADSYCEEKEEEFRDFDQLYYNYIGKWWVAIVENCK